MQDGNISPFERRHPSAPVDTGDRRAGPEAEVVSTHVLVAEEQVQKLRELSRRTRIAQSEYLREAVEDLLSKYGPRGHARDRRPPRRTRATSARCCPWSSSRSCRT